MKRHRTCHIFNPERKICGVTRMQRTPITDPGLAKTNSKDTVLKSKAKAISLQLLNTQFKTPILVVYPLQNDWLWQGPPNITATSLKLCTFDWKRTPLCFLLAFRLPWGCFLDKKIHPKGAFLLQRYIRGKPHVTSTLVYRLIAISFIWFWYRT